MVGTNPARSQRMVSVHGPTLTCDTPLHVAAGNGHTATCALLLDRGADLNAMGEVCLVLCASQPALPACDCSEVGPSVLPDTFTHWPAALLSTATVTPPSALSSSTAVSVLIPGF